MHKSQRKKRSRDRKHHKREPSSGSSIVDDSESLTSIAESDENENGTFIVKRSKVMGRYVVASRDLSPGTIILQEKPVVVGPCTGCKVICLGCYYNLEKDADFNVHQCKGCGWPLCSRNCIGLYKEYGHTLEECAVLKHTKSSRDFDYNNPLSIRPHYNAIVPLRCLLLKTINMEKHRIMMTMEPHNEIRRNIPLVWNNNQINVVNRIIKHWGLTEYEEEEIHTVCGILEVNAFEIGQHGISIRGIYPTAFLLSHDCVPNTTHTDEDLYFRLTIRASTAISAQQPITLSYAYTLQSTLKRREHLLESKFFNCACKRCADPTELGTNAGALLCPKCSSGLVLSMNPLDSDASWSCNNTITDNTVSCPGYTVTAKSMRMLMDKISDEIESIDGNNVKGFEAILHRYRNVLHPKHYHCLSVKHSLSQLYGKISDYMIHQLPKHLLYRKQDICRDILTVFNVLEPGHSRLRGITLYELHAPIMILATRDFEARNITKDELRERLKEVVRCLHESSIILGYEPDNSVEGIMAHAAKDALNKIRDWERILGKIYSPSCRGSSSPHCDLSVKVIAHAQLYRSRPSRVVLSAPGSANSSRTASTNVSSGECASLHTPIPPSSSHYITKGKTYTHPAPPRNCHRITAQTDTLASSSTTSWIPIMPNNKRKPSQPNSSTDMENYQVRTLQKKRTTNFREDETKLLISLWGSPVIQNKLYLTHRKAPVMRLLAANMQQRGFYRSPDEIKTRIRNLKCLYHRIKRTMVTGSGIGTVDPDWPHFKAMDAILGKEGIQQKQEKKMGVVNKEENLLEGPRCEDIKQEVELDINDDMESWAGNESIGGSDYEEHHIPQTSLIKTMSVPETPQSSVAEASAQLPTVLPNISVSTPQTSITPIRANGAMSSTIPLPLLILNHGIPTQPQAQEKKATENASKTPSEETAENNNITADLNNTLREMLNVQKQQLELEKQKFEFDRLVGTQLMTLVPMVGGLLQRLVYPTMAPHNLTPPESSINENNETDSKSYHEKELSDYDLLKDSKILRTVLERGIKKYMMSDETRDSNKDNDSDNDDSGITDTNNLLIDNDNSNSNSK
ncbi:SET and MYND domain containing arthropod-specific member 4 [Carabus blaptoides fortunei]